MTIYVQTARDLGCIEDDHNKPKYYVGNGLEPIELHPLEYAVWRSAAKMQSIETWRAAMAQKLQPKTKVPFEKIEKRLVSLKVLHSLQFQSAHDDDLAQLFVIRNGYAFGQRGENWVIGTYDQQVQFKLNSKLEFDIWLEASNYRSLLEIVLVTAQKNTLPIDEALTLVCRATRNFVRAGIWTVEYIKGGSTS